MSEYTSYSNDSWTQLGSDIAGEAATYDYSGHSVSLSSDGTDNGNRSLLTMSGNGNASGHVRVYDYNGTAWSQLGADIDGESGRRSIQVTVSFPILRRKHRSHWSLAEMKEMEKASGHVRVISDY